MHLRESPVLSSQHEELRKRFVSISSGRGQLTNRQTPFSFHRHQQLVHAGHAMFAIWRRSLCQSAAEKMSVLRIRVIQRENAAL